jgi:tetratricopeptide (TPR) repeat protein/predicted Ser/Thr protein kinase
MIGQTVSHYRIIEKLGEGGMGVVYLAEDQHLARRVAIKFLTSTDHHYRARFIREARAVSGLNHPNIAIVHDYGETAAGQPFLVMEYIKGKSLSDLLGEGLTLRRSVEIVSSITEALGEAHDSGIVHRDIKPSNVLINERGNVKVLDFGLVKHLFEPTTTDGVDLDAQTIYSTQTRSDVIVGTPLYLSPEQATGKQIDGRSDLFALGALLYECLTGQSAFSGGSVLEIGAQIIHVTPAPPSALNPQIPAELDRITLKALEKKVEARYQNAEELLRDLRAVALTLSGNGIPVMSKAHRPTDGFKRGTNAFATLTMQLRRQRFSLATVVPAFVVAAIAIWAVIHWWPRSYYQPSAAALSWYERGTDNLRNGAYFQASKALAQAIEIDNRYALARARLAQAWSELDYYDRAKDELLAATTIAGDRSSVSPRDRLYLDAISAVVRRDFKEAVNSYTQIAQLTPDDSQVYVDLGYAYENDGNPDQALDNYLKAIKLNNDQYATAYLRAGIVYHRKTQTAKAQEMFDVAERLYRAASNPEGVNEVLRQRGILFRDNGKYPEADAQFRQSLDAARAIGNEAQQINALIELSYLSSSKGSISEAENFAQQAVTFAQQKQLENLTAGALLELGNTFSTQGDLKKAEQYFSQAIQFAQANKGRLREARGLSNLGGLYIQTLRIDEGLRMVQQALDFFQRGNYPRNVSSCLTQIGRGYRRKGDYAAALQSLNQKLEFAKQSNTQPQIADSYQELGALFFDQEKWPAALEHYENAQKVYESIGNKFRIAFCKANRGNILWRLGQYGPAQQLLDEVVATTTEQKGTFLQLLPAVNLVNAEMRLSERNFPNATALSTQTITMAGQQYPDVAIQSKYVHGLAKAFSGGQAEAQKFCEEALAAAATAGDFGLHSRALLAAAEAALARKDGQKALSLATEAVERFARGGQLESEWRAWLVVSGANALLGNRDQAIEQAKKSLDAMRKLEEQWGQEAFKRYSSRPDIQVYMQQQQVDLNL